MTRTCKTSESIEVLFIIASMLRPPCRTLWCYVKKVFFCRLHSLQCCLFLISRTRTITIPIFLFNLPVAFKLHGSCFLATKNILYNSATSLTFQKTRFTSLRFYLRGLLLILGGRTLLRATWQFWMMQPKLPLIFDEFFQLVDRFYFVVSLWKILIFKVVGK